MKTHSLICTIFFLTLFIYGSILTPLNTSKAQVVNNNITQDIILEIIPKNPSPGQQVRFEVESYVTNLQQASITWSVDGEVRQQEIGNQLFIVSAPDAGEQVAVRVDVIDKNNRSFSENYILVPGGLDIIVEGITYTPPLYKGRSLFTHESQVNIAAIPTIIENGRRLLSNEIFYQWEINDTYIRDVSGVGRDNIIYTGKTVSLPITVGVTAESLNSGIKARKLITVSPMDPELILYETNPLQGTLFTKALLGEFNMEREELTLTAIPYFFNVNKKDANGLDYYWADNGKKVNSELISNELTLSNAGLQRNGTSEIFIATNHTDHLLQDASTGFTLNILGNNQINIQNDNEITVF